MSDTGLSIYNLPQGRPRFVETPTTLGNIEAAFARDSFIGQAQIRLGQSLYENYGDMAVDPNYDPFRDEDPQLLLQYADYGPDIREVRSSNQFRALIDRIRYNQDLELQLNANGASWSRFLAPVLDADILAPFPVARGLGFVQGAKRGALFASTAIAATEVARVYEDPLAAPEQLAYTIPGSMVAASAIGGLAGMMGKRSKQTIYDLASSKPADDMPWQAQAREQADRLRQIFADDTVDPELKAAIETPEPRTAADSWRPENNAGISTLLSKAGSQFPYWIGKENRFGGTVGNRIAETMDRIAGTLGYNKGGQGRAGVFYTSMQYLKPAATETINDMRAFYDQYRGRSAAAAPAVSMVRGIADDVNALRGRELAMTEDQFFESISFLQTYRYDLDAEIPRSGTGAKTVREAWEARGWGEAEFEAVKQAGQRAEAFFEKAGIMLDERMMKGLDSRLNTRAQIEARIDELNSRIDGINTEIGSLRAAKEGGDAPAETWLRERTTAIRQEINELNADSLLQQAASGDMRLFGRQLKGATLDLLRDIYRKVEAGADGATPGIKDAKLARLSQRMKILADLEARPRLFIEELGKTVDDWNADLPSEIMRGNTGELQQLADWHRRVNDIIDKVDLYERMPSGGFPARETSYLSHFYNAMAVDASEAEVKAWLRQKFKMFPQARGRKLSEAPKAIEERVNKAFDRMRRLATDGEGDMQAFGDMSPAGPRTTFTRVLPFSQAELIGDGSNSWIVTDIRQIISMYEQKTAPAMAMADEFGDSSMWQEMRRLMDEMDDEIDKAVVKERNMKKAERLIAEKARQTQALIEMRDKALKRFMVDYDPTALSTRLMNLGKNWSILTMMGKAWQAAIPDVGRLALAVNSRAQLNEVLEILQGHSSKLTKQEAALAGEAIESFTLLRSAAIAEHHGGFINAAKNGWLGKAEAWTAKQVPRMFMLNLLAPWTDFWKHVGSTLVLSDILRTAKDVAEGAPEAARKGTLSLPTRLERMKELGLTPADLKVIHEQWTAAGAQGPGNGTKALFLANTEAWTDPAMVRKIRGIIAWQAENMIITPGIADKPNLMSKPLWSFLFQFKSFAMTATQRIAMSSIQHKSDPRILSALGVMLVGGAMVESLRGSPYSSPTERAIRVVDYSGITGIIMDLNNQVEIASGGAYGLRPMFGETPMVKTLTPLQQAAAPFGPTISQIGRITGALSAGEGEPIAGALRTSIPFANLWFINGATSAASRLLGSGIDEVSQNGNGNGS